MAFKLGKTVAEVDQMSAQEFAGWALYFGKPPKKYDVDLAEADPKQLAGLFG